MHAGDADEARAGETEALGIFRELGGRIGEAVGLIHLGQICANVGDGAQARQYLEQCLAIGRAIKNLEVESECERMLGEVAFDEGILETACLHFARSLALCRDAGDKRGEATALWWLGKAVVASGNVESARIRLGGELRAFKSFEMHSETLGCLEDHADLAHSLGSSVLAVQLLPSVAAVRERLVLTRSPRHQQRWEMSLASARTSLGDVAFDAAWSEGRTWEVDEAVRRALSPTVVEFAAA